MTKSSLFTLTLVTSCTLLISACGLEGETESDTPAGELLYSLSEAEVQQIHALYAADEALGEFQDRLTAPFDCTLYADFCAQVGREGAYTITGEMVDLALDGAPAAEIEAHVDARIEALSAELEDDGDAELEGFRAAGPWTTQTNGNFRLRVRNGVTSPLFGDRRAWTEAKTQKKSLGVWSNKNATQLCVNAGTNLQRRRVTSATTGTREFLLESINPANSCAALVKTRTVSTYHERNNGTYAVGVTEAYHIHANGCATAEINGLFFSRCAAEHTQMY